MTRIIGLAALARSGKDTVASMLLEHDGVAAFALADPLKAGCQALFGLTSDEAWNDDKKEEIIPHWSLSPRQMFQQVGTEWMRNHNPEHWLMRADKEITHSHDQVTPSASPADLAQLDAPIRLASQAFFGLTNEQTWSHASLDVRDEYWAMSPSEIFELVAKLSELHIPDFLEKRASQEVKLPERKELNAQSQSVIIIKDIRFENEAEFWRSHGGVIWHIQRHNASKVNQHTSELGIKVNEQDTIVKNNGTLAELKIQVDRAWLSLMANTSP